jgi:hypothetical protein
VIPAVISQPFLYNFKKIYFTLTTIRGVYNQGQITLEETPANINEPVEVYVTFTEKKRIY